ncbi:MAG: diaminopimelate epimerase [Acidimicrobiales bacterium]|nr:diaminopimelate epimerase [Acidimicrobiales bacterium]
MRVLLTKHHGLGNDFLVALGNAADLAVLDAAQACRWCDRRRGIGADGLLLGATDDPDWDLVMTLYNADGSLAEMSGNGIRCLAQAEARRRGVDHVTLHILTGGGARQVEVHPGSAGDPASVVARVEMGPARPGPAPERADEGDVGSLTSTSTLAAATALGLDARRSGTYDLGNPHLVLLVDDPEAVDLAAAGSFHEACYPHGINVHFVAPAPDEADAMTMRVWERGAGVTEACGTGAVAVARAAHDWGLVGPHVTIHMPGGDVTVDVGDPMVLVGPATYVGTVELEA